MWALDFCNKRSSDCIQIAEECADADQRRAWLQLAKEWVKLAEQAATSKRGGMKRAREKVQATATDADHSQVSQDR